MLAPQGELLQLEGSLGQVAGGKHCPRGALVEHARIPRTNTEASYYCVTEPGFDSSALSKENIFFFQIVIFIKFTSLN